MRTRREFLGGALRAGAGALSLPASLHLASCAGGPDGKDGKEGEDRRPLLVDTHMHVWSDDTQRFPFSHPYRADFQPPPIAGTVEMLLDEMDRHGIAHVVLVQVIYHGWDNRYVARCRLDHPQRFRVQGLIDPTDPERAGKLEYWVREHGLSGMRFSPIYYPGEDDWLDAKESFPLWEKAAELGAVFNFFIAAAQLPKLEKMVKRFPEVPVVIDHLARVELGGAEADAGTRQLVALARYPSVSVKVSELSVISPSKRFPYRDTYPLVRRVHDAFGADRLLWGTGFPGATRAQGGRPSLEEELALIREEIPFFTDAEREKILGKNAATLWGFEAV
ncbi:MAG: amidohydrolase family protein [Planctomycetota bacterium]|nr:amidohydrolase family protein [Planctomycetota bacterium]